MFKPLQNLLYSPAASDPDDETRCHFVSSKGLMKTCELFQPLPNDAGWTWAPGVLRRHKPGGRIYVHATALADFARRALPRITQPFILVSGDCIWDVSPDPIKAEAFHAILNHPHLIHWHAQNLNYAHPKMSPIPLGLDYHTLDRRAHTWGPRSTPRAQEELLQIVRRSGPRLAERAMLAHSTWHFALKNGDRAQVLDALPSEATFYEPAPTSRSDSWWRNSRYAFTISPRGNGQDCHRTWEAILLGSVPLISELAINALFANLPVIVVKDWRSVTPAYLADEHARLLTRTYDFAPLFLRYWTARIAGTTALPQLRLGYQEFMDLTDADMDAALPSVTR